MKIPPAAFLFAAALALPALAPVLADAPAPTAGKPLDAFELHERLYKGLNKLHTGGKLPAREALEAQLTRKSCALEMPGIKGKPMELPELYRTDRKGVMIIGSLRTCGRCNQTHMAGTASGYILTASGVMVTNYHVIDSHHNDNPDKKTAKNPKTPAAAPDAKETAGKDGGKNTLPPAMPLGLGAMDQNGHVYAVKEVLAASKDLDIAIVQLDGTGFTPLPVNPEAEVGEKVAVISHPMRHFYMLSTGIITNRMRLREGRGTDRGPRLCVSAEYGVGSSGAPVFNMRGEVVGMVSSTTPIMTPPNGNGVATEQMVMRYCVPMKEILGLIRKPGEK